MVFSSGFHCMSLAGQYLLPFLTSFFSITPYLLNDTFHFLVIVCLLPVEYQLHEGKNFCLFIALDQCFSTHYSIMTLLKRRLRHVFS